MRSNFPGFYSLNQEQLNDVWDRGILMLDTNVLLDFIEFHRRHNQIYWG